MKKVFKLYNIFIFLLIIFFIGLSFIYEKEENQLKINTLNKIQTQSKYINEYFLINKAFILSLKNSLLGNLNIDNLVHPAFGKIKNKEKKDIYNILCNVNDIKSTLNGVGSLANIDIDTIQEINSILYLNPLFKTILNSEHDIQWVYYSSKKEFIYIAPTNEVWDKKFLKYLYTKEFWTEAIPSNNPSGELILTKIYDDGAGKGYMTTLSLPIFFDSEFRGILSIDIALKTLNKMINNIKLPGKIYLTNEDDLIISSNQVFKLDEYLDKKHITFSLDLFDNKLKLVYIENKKNKILTILLNILPIVILLLFSLIIVYILMHQVLLIKKIKIIANKDFLTSLLNRRAMMRETIKQLEIANRYNLKMSLLLLDIDFFKKVNDTYGHQAGDLVIQEISKILAKNTRESDLV